MYLGNRVLRSIGKLSWVFKMNINGSMVGGNGGVIRIPPIGYMEEEGNGRGEEIIDLRSSQARSGERFGILRKALNLEW